MIQTDPESGLAGVQCSTGNKLRSPSMAWHLVHLGRGPDCTAPTHLALQRLQHTCMLRTEESLGWTANFVGPAPPLSARSPACRQRCRHQAPPARACAGSALAQVLHQTSSTGKTCPALPIVKVQARLSSWRACTTSLLCTGSPYGHCKGVCMQPQHSLGREAPC